MIKLIREQNCLYRESYQLNLDEEYVTSVANYFHKQTNYAYMDKVEITAEFLAKVFSRELTEQENIEIEVYYGIDRSFLGKTKLQDYLWQILNDDLWSCDYESEYVDSYDHYDSIGR